MRTVALGNRILGTDNPTLIVAELGINHNGSLDEAVRMVYAIAKAGADAVKVQAFEPEEICDPGITLEWGGRTETQRALFNRCHLSVAQLRTVRDVADQCGLMFFGTPSDRASADALDSMGAPCFKVGSDELVNASLLRSLASKGKPVFLSTGMAAPQQIHIAIRNLYPADVVLLHCVSLYPTLRERWNLRRILTLRRHFAKGGWHEVGCYQDPLIGYSDHSEGVEAATAAVFMGAVVIEKHFTMHVDQEGPDHAFSTTPVELGILVRRIRAAEIGRGAGYVTPSDDEAAMKRVARRVLIAKKQLPPGAILRAGDYVAKRSANIHPSGFPLDLSFEQRATGARLREGVNAGEVITSGALGW